MGWELHLTPGNTNLMNHTVRDDAVARPCIDPLCGYSMVMTARSRGVSAEYASVSAKGCDVDLGSSCVDGNAEGGAGGQP